MSYYENNFIEQNMENFNNLEEGYDNGDNFYYLTENEQNTNVVGLNDNIYEEDNYVEHMENQRQVQVSTQQPGSVGLTGSNVPVPEVLSNMSKSKKSKKSEINWLYILVVILVISLIAYYLIDNKMIKLPSFGSSSSTSSPTSSAFRATLGSTFMSLH